MSHYVNAQLGDLVDTRAIHHRLCGDAAAPSRRFLSLLARRERAYDELTQHGLQRFAPALIFDAPRAVEDRVEARWPEAS